MQRAKIFGALFAYVNNIQITWKTIHLSVFYRTNSPSIDQSRAEGRKDSMAECCQWVSERACVTSPFFGQGTSSSLSSLCVYPSATRRTTSASVLLICIN